MTHDQIDSGDIVDRFVAGTLDAATAEAFEEHFFGCDECFAKVESLEAMRGAVRHAASRGDLRSPSQAAPVAASAPSSMQWLQMAASLVLAAGLGWMAMVTVPSMRSELESSRADRERLQAELNNAKTVVPAAVPPIEANLAIATLSSERGVAPSTSVTIDPAARQFVLVIDAPESPNGRGRLEVVADATGAEVASTQGLVRGANGLWTVSLQASSFPDARYRVRLRADDGGQLLGEYILNVSRRR
jgi:hypothetical protein